MATAVRHLNGMREQARACLRRAAECERAAVLASDPGTQAIYRDLARQWREMVEQYEDLDRLRGALQKSDHLALRRARASSGSQSARVD
jgi:hypothetical protein